MANANSDIATRLNEQMLIIMNAENSRSAMRARSVLSSADEYPATLLEYVQHHLEVAHRDYERRTAFIENLNQLQTVIMSIEGDIPYLRNVAGWQ
jgi:hypothetical protein